MTLYVSPSGLNDYFSCPAKYLYRTQWRAIDSSVEASDGTAVHQLLAGETPDRASPRALKFYERLNRMRREMGYEILATEVRQILTLERGVYLVRVIDAMAILNGVPVLVDYKTLTWPYKKLEGTSLTPQTMGFQAAAYLLPPPDPAPFEEWPQQIHFLSSAERGGNDLHIYEYFEGDKENLMMAIQQVKATSVYPKVRGYGCNYCWFADMCYELPGFETKYVPKGEHHDPE